MEHRSAQGRPDPIGSTRMSNMLKFTKLRLKNWKNFKSVEVDLQ